MRVRTRSFVLSALLCGVSPVALSAAAPQSDNRVIVRALTGAGQPVTDLKPEELTIRADGKDRKVQSLELVTVPTGTPPAAGPAKPAAAAALPAPYASNAAAAPSAAGGREFLFILDEEGVGPGREPAVRDAVTQLLSSAAASDRFGLISLRQGGFDVPASPAGIVGDTLAKFVGGGSPKETVPDMVCRTKRAMQTLTAALRASSVGRTIVMISPGLPGSPTGVQPMRKTTGDASQSEFSDVCQIRSNDFDALSAAAAASPANIYMLHYPDGLAAVMNVREAQQGLENITGSINGEWIRISGGNSPALGRILTETSSYYLATLDQSSAASRRVDVRTSREGIKISARPTGAADGSAAGAAAKAGSPRDMIRVPTVYREVPIRAAGFVSRQPGAKEMKVVALFEPEDPAAKLTAAIVALFDDKGNLKAQWTAQAAELGRSPIVAALTAAPGKYRMRVAASDSAGKAGTTDYPLAVELPDAPPVKLSTMLLGVGQGGFSPKLAFTAADAAAIGFIEIYGVSKDAKVETTFEIIKPDGEVMGNGQGTVGAGPGDDARIAYGGFGIATLEPGDYTMRVTISVDGKQAGVASRTLRKLK